MAGADFQSACTHGIPATKKVHTPRTSFTFRLHNRAKEEEQFQKWQKQLIRSAPPPGGATSAAKKCKTEAV
jgi:hypothetical protein